MAVYQGTAAAPGLALGPVHFYAPAAVTSAPIGTPEEELARFRQARADCLRLQDELYAQALEKAGEEAADIFNIHAMLLQEDDLEEYVLPSLHAGHSAAEAAVSGFEALAAMFEALDDDYMRLRGADLRDLGQEMAALLTEQPAPLLPDAPCILAADTLAPSTAVRLEKDKLLGILLRRGSTRDHTAILARSMGIPLVVECEAVCPDWEGRTAALDGTAGTAVLEPDAAAEAAFAKRLNAHRAQAAALEALRGKPTVTATGRTVKLYANIGSTADIPALKNSDAEGVGMFRSEFLCLQAVDWPGEEEQYWAYRAAVEAMNGRRVVVRTFDLGADKTAPYMNLPAECNPALGCRGIRFCLSRPNFFKTQLRALLRAAACGQLAVMFPMVSTAGEVSAAAALLEQCRAELAAEGVPTGPLEVGAMIETPAAALCAGEIAALCSFVSIGTNDLFQYTFAMDRENPTLSAGIDPTHPALTALIRLTVEAAHAHDCSVCVCGELAAEAPEKLLALGVDCLSVAPPQVLPLRRAIAEMNL